MNQIADILKLAREAQKQKVDAVLATVFRTEGSAYRRAGAMMLICADGRSVGMISGGCLEPHIIKRAFWLTRHGANVQTYQTGDDIEYTDNGEAKEAAPSDDKYESEFLDADFHNENYDDLDSETYDELDELNFGLGCNGRVHVLFERLATATPLLEVINRVRRTQQPIMIATLIRSGITHDNQMQIGMRVNLNNYAESRKITIIGTHNRSNQDRNELSSTLINVVEKLSQHRLGDKNAEYVTARDNGNHQLTTEWLVQRIEPQIRLLICGAGNDVMPLVTMAKLQDWHVTVVDSRAQYATRMRFPQADEVMPLSLEDTETLLQLSNNAAIALMSHSLSQDRARLATLLPHSNQYKYLGQLGPRYRTERLIEEISATNINSATLAAGVSKLHYPIGYKLGGDGPEALALGVMAQINAVMHEQTPSAKCVDLANNDVTMMSHA